MTRRTNLLLFILLATFGLYACDGSDGNDGPPGPEGPQGPPGPPGGTGTTSVEACLGCHGAGGVLPVGDIYAPGDAHYLGDTSPMPPETASGYRQLFATVTEVDVTGMSVGIEFAVEDENTAAVTDLFASDGWFTIARLDPQYLNSPATNSVNVWVPFLLNGSMTQASSEAFTNGTFTNNLDGTYSYMSAFDPTSVPVMDGDTLRVGIQIFAGDLPTDNAWCDFAADTTNPNDCINGPPPPIHRDIVDTTVCNGCHGVTPEVRLSLHGGRRTEVGFCVTCHNPSTTDTDTGNSVNMPVLIHNIHNGANLPNGYTIIGFGGSVHDYSTVQFTKDIDDCVNCHTGSQDSDNWYNAPGIAACSTSCHQIDITSPTTTHPGAQRTDNSMCATCHPAGMLQLVHEGAARRTEADTYASPNGIHFEAPVDYDFDTRTLSVEYSVMKSGSKMDLANDPEWASGSITIRAAWPTTNFTNEGGSSAPAQPASTSGLPSNANVTDLMNGNYLATLQLPSSVSGSAQVTIEARPRANLSGGPPPYSDTIPVVSKRQAVNVGNTRNNATIDPRRQVVDVANCDQCHDAAGQGISLHGENRTNLIEHCAMCHNANATDINRRPADPADAVDGKREESIDIKRLVHLIHSGAELANGYVVYGFNNSIHDFSTVEFIGNRQNCETCHMPGTYTAEAAFENVPSTIDTGADEADPSDDLNISPMAAVCSACHDDDVARNHMLLNGATFSALDDDIL